MMEFKLCIRARAYVVLAKFRDGIYRGEVVLWKPEFRKFDVDVSSEEAAKEWAKNFSEFTGFEIVTKV
jgi:hypothetical protein